ncbi:MAG: PKD domain-containing protein [Patescibacteria group bacterium]
MKKASLASFALAAILVHPLGVFAQGVDLSVDQTSLRFSTNVFVEGQKVKIYATATNKTSKDLYGVIRFFDDKTKKQIGTDQPISVFAGKTDDVFIDWYPNSGSETVSAKLYPFEQDGDNVENNSVTKTVSVESDFDRDGNPDITDVDDDNDRTADNEDAFPKNKNEQKDTDGDGKGDNEDLDDDNDGIPDTEDALPLDPTETKDNDKDGIGDNKDPNDDNDGLYDGQEIAIGTNPKVADTDGDGVIDGKDAFPLDPKESKDSDHDGIGDNADSDRDNDGIPNIKDKFPENLTAKIQVQGVPFIVAPGEKISLNASETKDPDGKIRKVRWKVDNEKEQEGVILEKTFTETGSHKITVKIQDDSGEEISKNYTIYVSKMGNIGTLGAIFMLIALAIYGGFKYITSASRRKKSKK